MHAAGPFHLTTSLGGQRAGRRGAPRARTRAVLAARRARAEPAGARPATHRLAVKPVIRNRPNALFARFWGAALTCRSNDSFAHDCALSGNGVLVFLSSGTSRRRKGIVTQYSMQHLSENTLFRADVPVWWDNTEHPAQRFAVILDTQLEELFTRYTYAKGAMEARFTVNGREYHESIGKDAPLFAVSRDTGEAEYLATHGAESYAIHAPDRWLAETANELIAEAAADGVQVETAVHIGKGAYSCISLSRPTTAPISGMDAREVFSLLTSQTGAMASSISRSVILGVCDNTTAAIDRDASNVRFKHTDGDQDAKVLAFRQGLRDFLASSATLAEDAANGTGAAAWISVFGGIPISSDEYREILEGWAPSPIGGENVADTVSSKNLGTRRQKMHDELWRMWADPTEARVAPWAGTLLGAYQALSTFDHYQGQIRGRDRASKLTIDRMRNRADDRDSVHTRVLVSLARSLSDDKATAVCDLPFGDKTVRELAFA